MPRQVKYLLLFSLSIVFAICTAIETHAQKFSVSGKVAESQYPFRPVPSFEVELDFGGLKPTKVRTTPNGTYTIPYEKTKEIAVSCGTLISQCSETERRAGNANYTGVDFVVGPQSGILPIGSLQSMRLLETIAAFIEKPEQHIEDLRLFSRLDSNRFPVRLQSLVRAKQRESSIIANLQARADDLEARLEATRGSQYLGGGNPVRLSTRIDKSVGNSTTADARPNSTLSGKAGIAAGTGKTDERNLANDEYTRESTISIQFDLGKAELTAEARTRLDAYAKEIALRKGYLLELFGFSAHSDSDERQLLISQQRADAVARYLVSAGNIPSWRIALPVGFGTERPIPESSAEPAHSLNDRVEITLLANRAIPLVPRTNSPAGP